jgi:hypothetical protein
LFSLLIYTHWETEGYAKGTYTRTGNTAAFSPTHYWDNGSWTPIEKVLEDDTLVPVRIFEGYYGGHYDNSTGNWVTAAKSMIEKNGARHHSRQKI